MGVQLPNSTDYIHPNEPNLLDLHKAMEYNSQGKPVLRATIGDQITINGNVIIPGVVEVSSSPENPVHVHVTELPEVEIKNDVGNRKC